MTAPIQLRFTCAHCNATAVASTDDEWQEVAYLIPYGWGIVFPYHTGNRWVDENVLELRCPSHNKEAR